MLDELRHSMDALVQEAFMKHKAGTCALQLMQGNLLPTAYHAVLCGFSHPLPQWCNIESSANESYKLTLRVPKQVTQNDYETDRIH